ncbi:MAG: spore coat protein [Eubacteriales bacterium]
MRQLNYGDKEQLTDLLSGQKFLTSNYNSYLNEAATPEVRQAFSQILSEEHVIENEIWQEMNRRGWYNVCAAEASEVTKAKQQFESVVSFR